jgi:signal transduction histidine kinase
MMNSAFRLRLALLIAAIAGVAGLTLLGLHYSWTRIAQLEHRLTSNQFESFRLAEEFQARLHLLNNSILRYAAGREESTWREFKQASGALDHWIDLYDPQINSNSIVTSDRERQLFRQINDAYDNYIRASESVRANAQPPATTPENLRQLKEFDAQAEGLLVLSRQLAEAHRQKEQAFLLEANRSLDHLRVFMSSGIIALLLLTGGIGWILYRDMVAPLRTKLVESEALLARQEKLATLGTLAAGIAHEIRNPLTSIKARLYTLRKHMKGNEPGLVDAGVITGEIARLDRIVQEVLQFARPSDPQRRVVPADLPFRELQPLIASSLEKGAVQLVFEPAAELYVSMDVALIKQVILNLVRNAEEAIEDTGTITMRVRASRANLGGASREVAILEVADNGRGIPPEIEQRLFDPFFTTKETGTGLGLSIAARIIEKHGGTLQYHTRVGHGTTFGIVLPVVSELDRPVAPASEAASEIASTPASSF